MAEQDSEMRSIQARLDRLERENRLLKTASLGVLLLVCALFTMAQSWSGRYVEANRFVLKDAQGRTRGQWAAQEDSSGFSLYDTQERPVMELLSAPEQHAIKLSLVGPKGTVSLWAISNDVGLTVKESSSPSAPERIFLGLRDTSPFLDPDAPPFATLHLNDSRGNEKVSLLTISKGGFALIKDDKGTPVWAMFKAAQSKDRPQ